MLFPQGGLSEDTRSKLALLSLTEPPKKPYITPMPKDGTIYDYKFVKEVRTTSHCIETPLRSES